jgi:hypothetical protein
MAETSGGVGAGDDRGYEWLANRNFAAMSGRRTGSRL